MICKNIEIQNFRNIENANVSFSDGINVLVGDNAQGKTNLLEGIYLFSLGKSFRGAYEADMIRFGEKNAVLKLSYTENSRENEQTLSMILSKDRRKNIFHNGVKVTRLSEMIGCFRAVLFCPEHLSIIKEGPSLRRSFIDVAISQFKPLYIKSLQKYNSLLEHRNKLLKNALDDKSALDTIDIWSVQLAHEASIISSYRSKYIQTVNEAVKKIFFDMTGSDEVPLLTYSGSSKQSSEEYEDKKITEEKYIRLLTENIEREVYSGSTLWGVHKDDIDISINGKNARVFASQGQQRSLALAMKLSEGEICQSETGDYPVFLLDDVLSELDERRRDYLLSSIRGKQVIMTTCEKTSLGGKITEVESGNYFERNFHVT